jgi:hypothetical protein
MYRLQIHSPQGQRVLQWDPRKLRERDPETLALLAEADRFLHEALAGHPHITLPPAAGAGAAHEKGIARVAVRGRWLD